MEERVRWTEGERGVRRAREPVVEVRRMGLGLVEEGVGEGRRVVVEG